MPGLDLTSCSYIQTMLNGVVSGVFMQLIMLMKLGGHLTVMNTWHEKKNIYKYTWHHPGCMMWN